MRLGREKHPLGFWFIFWGELAERASFYGMKALLALYLVAKMGYTEDTAGPINHIFTAFCYLLPLLGGYVADRWLGKFRTILYFAIPYICGHVILGTWEMRVALFIALALLAGGSGAIKPNLSPLMGLMYDQQGKSRELRAQAFSWFYAAINIGAASTMTTLPWVRDHYGYQVAFLIPAVMMVMSFAIFALGRKHYPKEEIGAAARPVRTAEERLEDRRVFANLAGIFAIIIFFWSIFDQASSTWVYFARDHLELHGLAPDMIQGLNPFLVVAMTPLFAFGWGWIEKRRGVKFTFTQKMMLGYVLTALCMGIMAVAGWITTSENKADVAWEVVAYIVITMAELCISIVGLEMAYAEAPERLKSTVTSVFLFTVFFGNMLAGYMSHLYPHMQPGNYFGALTVLMVGVATAFYIVGRRFERRKLVHAV